MFTSKTRDQSSIYPCGRAYNLPSVSPHAEETSNYNFYDQISICVFGLIIFRNFYWSVLRTYNHSVCNSMSRTVCGLEDDAGKVYLKGDKSKYNGPMAGLCKASLTDRIKRNQLYAPAGFINMKLQLISWRQLRLI